MADAGCATATGRTKVRSAAVVAVAACGATIPAKSTPKPTTAMVTTAATLFVETTVPSTVKHGTDEVEASVRGEAGVGAGPVNSTRRSSANEPKAPNRRDLRIRERRHGR